METTTISVPGICELSNGDNSFEVELLRPLSLIELSDSDIGEEFMCQQDWYKDRPWAQAQVPTGKYAVRLPIPRSSKRTTKGQASLLLPGEKFIPVSIAALVLLCLRKGGYPDPLSSGWLRCAEETVLGDCAALGRYNERLTVFYYWDDCHHINFVWAGGVRTS